MIERVANWIAWHLPKQVVYHALIRAWAHGTIHPYDDTIAPDITTSEIVSRWARDAGMPGHGH